MSNQALKWDDEPELATLLREQFASDALDHSFDLEGERLPWQVYDEALYAPLSNFLSRPSKLVRKNLVEASWYLAGGKSPPPRELPALVEVVHAGSLIVDDIEDGSAYRRGAPALHIGYGLPAALNAGCWLYFWPHALIDRLGLEPVHELAVRRILGRTLLAAHQGQALDLATRISSLAQRHVPSVVRVTTRLKTGALVRLAAELGAVALGADEKTCRALGRFGMGVGTALQMADDLGGIVSEARCHKGHEDLLGARPTWPWAWLAESQSELEWTRLANLEREVVARDTHPEILATRMRELIGEHGRRVIRARLDHALGELRPLRPEPALLSRIERHLAELEASYG